ARRGDPGAFGAMGITLSVTSASAVATETASTAPIQENKPVARRPVTGNAKVVELDL
ncbi:MAG: hypothetical protein H0V70_01690, partial [Ktedonobacteraceae bacterium]|nr:hypothetical protein [Ktedonobacteraceae bacterium]